MRTLKEFLRFYFQHLDQFETRIKAFRINWKSRILEELVFCLCTPQTSPLKADLATKRIVSYYEKVEKPNPLVIQKILRSKKHYVRFHITKSKNISEALKQFQSIKKFLLSGYSAEQEREYLVKNVKGLSFKEASHFLRNIGRSGLAIIDRHVIRFLAEIKVVRIVKSLDLYSYIKVESQIREFCLKNFLNIDAFDLAVFTFKTGFFLK